MDLAAPIVSQTALLHDSVVAVTTTGTNYVIVLAAIVVRGIVSGASVHVLVFISRSAGLPNPIFTITALCILGVFSLSNPLDNPVPVRRADCELSGRAGPPFWAQHVGGIDPGQP